MKIKKIPKILAISLLTGGASLIIGLLSFGGMFALWPCLAFAGVTFGLSVAFEGEVFYQNIKNALQKIWKPEYFSRQLAKEYLRTHFPKTFPRPEFFRDYQEKLEKHHQFKHKVCTEQEEKEKAALEKELGDMEKWFALQLFANEDDVAQSAYQKELRTWLAKNEQGKYQETLKTHRSKLFRTGLLSALAGICACFGSSYLLLEAFAIVPFTAALPVIIWPMLIVPMAIIAGSAYGFLTYNAFSDMISKNTLSFWKERFSQYLNKNWQDWKPNSIFMAATEVLLLSLIVTLTLCTAGTWRTIIQQTPPLFKWMKQIPTLMTQVIFPVFTGLIDLVFKFQNTSETLEMIDKANRYVLRSLPKLPPLDDKGRHNDAFRNSYIYDESAKRLVYIKEEGIAERVTITDLNKIHALLNKLKVAYITSDEVHESITLNGGHIPKGNVFTHFIQSCKEDFAKWQAIENPWHKWNPFRLIINLTYTPAHRSLFVGHLTSAAVTADRVPGVSEKASAFLGFVCDAAVDAHYFLPHKHELHDHSMEALLEERLGEEADHDHHTDFPTRVLKLAFFPIHILADGWDWLSSNEIERKPFSLIAIWKKLMEGEPPSLSEHTHSNTSELFIPKTNGWLIERTKYRIQRYKEKHLQQAVIGQPIAKEKADRLTELQNELTNKKVPLNKGEQIIRKTIKAHLNNAENASIYSKQRFFAYGETATTAFLEQDLFHRVMPRT